LAANGLGPVALVGATAGCRHHGDYATYAYITEGSMVLECEDDVVHIKTGIVLGRLT